MKKVLKYAVIILAMFTLVVLLTGCGKKETPKTDNNANKGTTEVSNGNKVVGTKTTTDEDVGTIKERLEATFKNDLIDEVKISFTFDDEETAQFMKDMYDLAKNMAENDDPFKDAIVEKNGTSVTVTMNAEMLEESQGINAQGMNMEEFKEELEIEGYTIEK